MTRSIMRWTVLALLGGALLTYAMAWGVIVARSFGGPDLWHRGGLSADNHPWVAAVPATWPRQCARWDTDMGLGITHVSCSASIDRQATEGATASIMLCDQTAQLAGWPFRALLHSVNLERHSPPDPNVPAQTETHTPHIPLWESARPWGPLPIVPIWSGLIADTFVFALALALLVAPIKLFRHSRRARGRCVKCGYILHSSTTCPECGIVLGND